jgi:hypothetical protein
MYVDKRQEYRDAISAPVKALSVSDLVQLARMSLQLAALLNGAKRLLEAVQESDERHAIDDLIFPPETRQEELRLIVSMAERYVDILQTIDDRTAGEAQ